jgi:hypothetical protein
MPVTPTLSTAFRTESGDQIRPALHLPANGAAFATTGTDLKQTLALLFPFVSFVSRTDNWANPRHGVNPSFSCSLKQLLRKEHVVA